MNDLTQIKPVDEMERCRDWIEAALEYSGGTHNFDDIKQGIVVDQDGTDNGSFRFDILRRQSIWCSIFGF